MEHLLKSPRLSKVKVSTMKCKKLTEIIPLGIKVIPKSQMKIWKKLIRAPRRKHRHFWQVAWGLHGGSDQKRVVQFPPGVLKKLFKSHQPFGEELTQTG